MFVLVYQNRVITGPMGWNRPMFDLGLKKVGKYHLLPKRDPQNPIHIDEETFIVPATLTFPEHNEKIQYLHGPFWTFDPEHTTASGTYEILDKDIDAVKATLKEQAAASRWQAEEKGATTTIQTQEVKVNTERDVRNVFFQKLMLMDDVMTVSWKFPDNDNLWLTINKSELTALIAAGAAYVQGVFEWERSKAEEIDACTTLIQLDAVDVVHPSLVVEEPVNPEVPEGV